jgi:hypothetical protein
VRVTSREAYEEIRASGRLNEMQMEVLAGLFEYGPATGVELTSKMKTEAQASMSYHKRLSELERMGAVYVVQRRPCSITGHRAIEWDVTDGLSAAPAPEEVHHCPTCGHKLKGPLPAPKPPEKAKPKKEKAGSFGPLFEEV